MSPPLDIFGDNINDYEVLHLLGKGGFASVYQARCLKSQQMIAIKMIDKKLIQSAGMEHRVRQEIEIHSRLKHPSILELYTFFQDANYVYLVLELASNGELQRYIKQTLRRPMTESEAANVLRQVVNGLLYLHSHRIMHRDISLSNLLLSWDMHVKIADFGLATQLKRPDERHVTMCGTPNYISPEVVNRTSHGLPADVWGLGCMFYTLLVGHPPFDTETVQRTLDKVITSDYYVPPHLPIDAINLIDNMLKKNPKDRIKLDDVLTHSFMIRHSRPFIPTNVVATNTNFTSSTNAITSSSGNSSSNSYNHEIATYDSGIITHSSNSSASKSNLLRPFMMENTMEQHRMYQTNTAMYSSNNINSNMFYEKSSRQFSNCADADKENYMQNNCLPLKSSSQSDLSSIQNSAGILTSFNTLVNSKNNWLHSSSGPVANTFTPTETCNAATENHSVMLVEPLNTSRLLPTRYKTKNAIMSILKDGNVVIEFVKFKAKYNEDRITDVCMISSNGQQILIHQPDHGRSWPIRDEPPTTELLMAPSNISFTYQNLPQKFWKKYMYAARFIKLVKSKTPKITYYSKEAKCALMESMEDFEVCFYDGSKVVKAPNDVVKIYNCQGQQLMDSKLQDYKINAQSKLEHADMCWKHCLNICKALELVEQNSIQACFPVVIGRRRIIDLNACESITCSTSNVGSVISTSTPKLYQTNSKPVYSNQSEKKVSMSAALSNIPIKRIHLPNIGVATELSHGVIQMQFLDGTLIARIPPAQGGGITFTERNGVSTHFAVLDDLPLQVREKLTHLPYAEQQLQQQYARSIQDNIQRNDGHSPMNCDSNININKGSPAPSIGSNALGPMRYFR